MRQTTVFLLMMAIGMTAFVSRSVSDVLTWERLRDVQFKKKWFIRENVIALYPQFGPLVKALNGKVVTITGYLIPIDVESNTYVLSAFPYSQCFFCGGAGPESVMMLKPLQPFRRFRIDERRCLMGTLHLNADNLYELNYILDGAILCEP